MNRKRNRRGKLTVIAGPMFSGKTGKLVAMVDVFTRMGHTVTSVKPKLDSRFGGKNEIHSHDHKTSAAIVVDTGVPEQVPEMIRATGADIVIFDEVQFFDPGKIKAVILALRKQGIHVIAAGLLYDYKRHPFGVTPELMGLADESLELFSVCQKCGSVARHSERVKGSRATVAVGASDMYIATCGKCHRIFRN
jgi:thymidine kinase